MLRRLDNVDDKVKAFFAPAAKAVLDNSDAHNALAAALAALSGIIEVPKQRRHAPSMHCYDDDHHNLRSCQGWYPENFETLNPV